MKRAVLVIVAACQQGSPAPSPPSSGSATHAPADARRIADAAAPLDAAPPDAADPSAHLFELAPAMIARDGNLVLVKVVDDDGARGMPNLALELRDRHDRAVDRVVVLATDEELDDKTRASRAAAADKLIKAHDLLPLAELPETDGHFSSTGVTVDWAHEHFTITVNGKRVVDRAVPVKWRGRSYFDKLADLTCDNPDFLRNVYVALDARLAVVDVAYRGNDTCWEPTGQLHIVTW